MEWILASASPRRRELLAKLVTQFEVIPATGEEVLQENLSPREQVQALAWQKAHEVASLAVAKKVGFSQYAQFYRFVGRRK